jgi:pimeloyl-ACP methyl ester carboxylesterase
MGMIHANGIQICFETFGDPDDPALLLVNGYTTQLTGWSVAVCEEFARRGRFVVRYDNRDVGLSTHFDGQTASLAEAMAARFGEGPMPQVPYTLSDMAADGIGLLSALGIDRAHIAGMSMGGMIVQTMAIEHPDRVLSLTSVMSNTGNPEFGSSTPEASAMLLRPSSTTRQTYIDESAAGRAVWSSPRYFDLEQERVKLAVDFDRMFYPEGGDRQYLAIVASPSREDGLRQLQVPTLVIHGRADTLITLAGGERTAALVPGANLLILNDMGHDLPEPLCPFVIDAMLSHQNHAASLRT